jgi:3-hydroxyisobutyrate dehydrogenase
LPKSKKKYLFIGLGTMGYPMAGHLSKQNNCDLFIFNRTTQVVDKWLNKYKGYKFDFNKLPRFKFDGLILCLKDDASIIDLLIKNKLFKCLKNNSFIIDHSTTSLELVNLITSNNEIVKRKISFFDSPVSGGEAGAIKGSLSVMIGGPDKKLSIVKKLIDPYSKTIVKIGPNGHGQLTKMVNQICIAGLIQGLSEAIALGKTSNLNMTKVFSAISNGAAQSWQMDKRFNTMVNNQFDFGFAVDLMIKDLKIALEQSKSNELNLTISKSVLKKYQLLSSTNSGNLDTSSLVKLFDV